MESTHCNTTLAITGAIRDSLWKSFVKSLVFNPYNNGDDKLLNKLKTNLPSIYSIISPPLVVNTKQETSTAFLSSM